MQRVNLFSNSIALGLCGALCACGGSGSNVPAAGKPLAGPGASGGDATASFVIVIPSRSAKASTDARVLQASSRLKPFYVSPSTQSIAISSSGGTPIPNAPAAPSPYVANLLATSPGCVAASGTTPLTCTLVVPAAATGKVTFTVSSYDQQNATGNVLSTATLMPNIALNANNTVRLTLNGVVASLRIAIANNSPAVGTAVTIPLTVTALDPDGNIIIAPGNYSDASGNALPITLTDSDASGTTRLTRTTLTGPATTASLAYYGQALPAGATITATATGFAPAGATFAPSAFADYPLISANALPHEITLGLDNNLWFTESNADNIGKITPNGVVTEYPVPSAGAYPSSIVAASDGALWFTELDGPAPNTNIGRITTSGTISEFPLPGYLAASFITTDAAGNLWFTELGSPSIGMLTTGGNETQYRVPGANVVLGGIAVGSDGNIWFGDAGDNVIGQLAPSSGNIVTFPVKTPRSSIFDLALGRDGNVWFTENGAGKIAKITASGQVTEYSLPSGGVPGYIVRGPYGNLWFDDDGTNGIGSITIAGTVTEYPIPTANAGPGGLAVGQHNTLWFTEPNVNRVGRFVPP